jgi:nucleotide-binding universal stress UspA family protein
MKTNKVLIPIDGFEFGLQVLPPIMQLLDPAHTKVVLMRVEPEPRMVEIGAPGDPDLTIYADQAAASLEADFHTEMLPALQSLEKAGFQVSTTMRFGDPTHEIERYLEEEEVDLVAMSTHGRTGLDRMLFGSVAEQVLHHARVPVLLVRPLGKVSFKRKSLRWPGAHLSLRDDALPMGCAYLSFVMNKEVAS